jgi:hypothetical protein
MSLNLNDNPTFDFHISLKISINNKIIIIVPDLDQPLAVDLTKTHLSETSLFCEE